MPSHATEEPQYQVVRELADIEVRQSAAYAVAEVLVAGPADAAGSQAFPILSGYIFGKNKGERKFAMTAPVTQEAAPVKMRMVAPVTERRARRFRGAVRLAQGRDGGQCARAPGRSRSSACSSARAGGRHPLFRFLVSVELRRAPYQIAVGIARCRLGWEGRAGVRALQRAFHALVHAPQRDLAAPGALTPPHASVRQRTDPSVFAA